MDWKWKQLTQSKWQMTRKWKKSWLGPSHKWQENEKKVDSVKVTNDKKMKNSRFGQSDKWQENG